MSLEGAKSEGVGEESPKQETGWYGARHTLALLGMIGCALNYAMRVNLSVAIVAMVRKKKNLTEITSSSSCPLPDVNGSKTLDMNKEGEFEWDEETQAFILGSFFYGYVITNLIGGRAAECYGGRIIAGVGIVATGFLTILSPFAARISPTLFVAVRIMEGLAGGVTLPSLNTLIARWYPIEERSKFASVIFLGNQIGTVIAFAASGWISASDQLGGWPVVFYAPGALTILWGVFWFLLITDDPQLHPRISKAELKYILNGCPNQIQKHTKVPWKEIFLSKYFWSIAIVHFGNAWSFYTLLTELPTYLDRILHIDLKNNGIISAVPNLGAWLFGMVFGVVADQLIARKMMSVLGVRRLSTIFSYGPMLGMVALCFVNCDSRGVIIILIASGCCYGTVYCGHLSSHADIAPKLAGTLMGLTNTMANASGFLVPLIIGALTQDNQTFWAWRIVFIISALVQGVSVTSYLFVVTTDVQPWNYPKE